MVAPSPSICVQARPGPHDAFSIIAPGTGEERGNFSPKVNGRGRLYRDNKTGTTYPTYAALAATVLSAAEMQLCGSNWHRRKGSPVLLVPPSPTVLDPHPPTPLLQEVRIVAPLRGQLVECSI